MCGLIFERFATSADRESGAVRMHFALQRLRHRGPDAQQAHLTGHAMLGHVRLSVIDLTASRQPMSSPDKRYWLVFNGEIYNYHELRRELAGRWCFRTQGDTEVLLAGLVLFGTRFIPRLDGMWAFVLWDDVEQKALLCRDRVGKKPLYYVTQPGGIRCASELPALRSLCDQPWAEDPDATADYFRYGFCMPGHTAWSTIHEVLPGHWMIWQPTAPMQVNAYWSLSLSTDPVDDDTLRDRFVQAVRKRLIADVEIGAFLSGGIDSSLVCATALPASGRLRTYTIGFPDESYDERRAAARVAEWLGTTHRSREIDEWEAGQLQNLLIGHFGQAFADASLLATSEVSRLAAEDVKVVLSGDGSDELFGGYQRYQAKVLLRWYLRLPAALRGAGARLIRALPEPHAHHSHSLLKKAYLFINAAQRAEHETGYVAPPLMDPKTFRCLFPDLVGHGHDTPEPLERASLDDLQQMLVADFHVYLAQDILAKVDRASMAFGLEVRCPFLDYRLVEAAFSRPAACHLRIGAGKRLLRAAFRETLPGWVWRRNKQGFSLPLGRWFRGRLGQQAELLLRENSGAVHAPAALALLEEHRKGQRDHGQILWAIYAYLIVRSASREGGPA